MASIILVDVIFSLKERGMITMYVLLSMGPPIHQWTGMGLTVGDWVGLVSLSLTIMGILGSVIVLVLKNKLTNPIEKVLARLSDSVDRLNESNEKRDQSYKELSEHVQQHDKQFVRDETRINEIFELLKGEFNDENKTNKQS